MSINLLVFTCLLHNSYHLCLMFSSEYKQYTYKHLEKEKYELSNQWFVFIIIDKFVQYFLCYARYIIIFDWALVAIVKWSKYW